MTVQTDQPLLACLASQYAGWQITGEKYFAMGSGPMRAARAPRTALSRARHCRQSPARRRRARNLKAAPRIVCDSIARSCGVSPAEPHAPRRPHRQPRRHRADRRPSVETALHKLHTLHYDLNKILSGYGICPAAAGRGRRHGGIGRTNDAVLYGGEVTLWLREATKLLAQIGPKIPSSASPDFGEPFADIFARFNHDFYKIDPLLFSPAAITLVNLTTGQAHRFGQTRPDVLARSFGR